MRIGHRIKLTLILGFGLHFVGHRKSRGNVALAIFVGAFFFLIQLPVLARPNILFILVDDLAWTDLGSYGHPWHHSPHIDRLATEGMRFTQAYSPAPICSSARASILTGKTPARLGLEFVVKAEPGEQIIEPPQILKTPPFTVALELREETIAETLQQANYQTAYFGKWHLNPHYQGRYLGWSPSHGPQRQGFAIAEEDFGSHPYSKTRLSVLSEEGQYHRDGLTERAIRFLEESRDEPFFLIVSHFFVHTPVQSPYAWLKDKYENKIPKDAPNRALRIEYAAFVETLDHHVGQLLKGLDERGHRESTLVVFISDNGGHPEYASHAPLRGSKWNLYEGGIRVPLLVRWPNHIARGAVSDTPVVGYDLFSTFRELVGAPEGSLEKSRDGLSLTPLFEDPGQDFDRALYWHFPYYHPEGAKFGNATLNIGVDDFSVSQTRPHSAIRKGNYKLLYFQEQGDSELYELNEDPSELSNLSHLLPAKTTELRNELQSYLAQVNARQARLP